MKNMKNKIMALFGTILVFLTQFQVAFAEGVSKVQPVQSGGKIDFNNPTAVVPNTTVEEIGDKITGKLYEIYLMVVQGGFWVVAIAVVIYLIGCAITKRRANALVGLLIAVIVAAVLPYALDLILIIQQWLWG